MSARKSITVTRTYQHEADACLRALTTLLKKPGNNEGGPRPATLDNDAKESRNDCAVTEHCT